MTPTLERLLPLLRCPASGSALSLADDGWLVNADGSRRYPIIDGIPVLLASERSLFDPARLGRYGAGPRQAGLRAHLRRGARWLAHLPPSPSRNVAASENYRALRRLLAERGDAPGRSRVLVVGGGDGGAGFEELRSDPTLDFVETDVYVGASTDVVCDGHDLPFPDGVFAAAVCQAVLEHVLDPWRVAEEIWRVLEPQGYVYSEVPFMQQVHEGAFDFTRFTQLGHRRLWRRFDELRSGAQGGPGMALAWSISYFLRASLPPRLWALADRAGSLGFFWLKYFDGWLVRRPGGLDAASGTFFLGRRRETALDDRTIVQGYRGGGPRLS